MINLAIIGFGYWGPRILKNIENSKLCKNVAICDINTKVKIDKKYRFYKNYKSILNNEDIDAIIIATPLNTHYEIAKYALKKNKHVWIEKPFVSNSIEAKKLIKIAKERKKIIFVDHPYIYSEAIKKVKKIVNNKNNFGELYLYDSMRVNLGIFRGDTNVFWDLAVHDISIIKFLTEFKPISINAMCDDNVIKKYESVGILKILYENNFIAHINVNWLAPIKIRQTFITGSNKMLLFNDVKVADKIQVFNKGIIDNDNPEKIGYRTGSINFPKIINLEPLANALKDFIISIKNNSQPISNGEFGLETIKILEAISKSTKNKGKNIKF